MKNKKFLSTYKFIFLLSISGIVLSGISILFVPLGDINGSGAEKAAVYIIGALLWFGVVFSLCMCCLNASMRKRVKGADNAGPIGLISFFKNTEGTVSDIIMFLSVLALPCLIFFRIDNAWLVVSVLSVLIISLGFHSYLNGKNYSYIKNACKAVKKEK